jgi:tetratricopeptide (TPR) repeat protein
MYTSRLDEAQSCYGKALKIYEQIASEFGADAKLRSNLASNHHNVGNLLSGFMGGKGHPKEAQAAYRQAVELYRGLTAETPDVAEYQSNLGGTLSDWAMVLLQDGEVAEAGPLLKEAITRQRAALKLEPRQPRYRQFLSSHLAGLADIAERQDRHEEAVKTAREALAVQETLANDFPDVPHYRHATAERAYDLGRLLTDDSAQDAETTFRQAIGLLEKLADSFAKVPQRRALLADCYKEIGLLKDAAGRGQDAEANYRAALKWEPQDVPTLHAFGINLLKQQKFADAEPMLRESLRVREQKLPDDWMTFEVRAMLGGALLGQKKYAEAEPLLLAGYEGMKQREAKIPEPEKARLTESVNWLVQLYEAKGQAQKSSEWRKKLAAKAPDKKD